MTFDRGLACCGLHAHGVGRVAIHRIHCIPTIRASLRHLLTSRARTHAPHPSPTSSRRFATYVCCSSPHAPTRTRRGMEVQGLATWLAPLPSSIRHGWDLRPRRSSSIATSMAQDLPWTFLPPWVRHEWALDRSLFPSTRCGGRRHRYERESYR